ncbi:MAG: YdcF family protein [Clostridia bacterium]|nr:YdcF family protein [Clostridia bacterium]
MVRFDTRDKKPKLYWLIPFAVVYAACLALLIAFGGEGFAVPMCIATIAFFSLTAAALFHAFKEQLKYNPYSYNTIYYIGFALFICTVVITNVILLAKMLAHPDLYNAEYIVSDICFSASNYMFFSAPFILAFSLALCVSNISLLIHERKRFVNVLGIILALLLIAGEVFLFMFDRYAQGSQFEVMMHDIVSSIFASIYLYFECMVIGAIIANIIVVSYKPDLNKDYIIILGCGLRPDGTPTPLLRGRIERALAFYNKQKDETGKELKFIASGGQGPNEVNSESTAIKRFLIEKGIPEEMIIEEDRSSSTLENMRNSKEIIFSEDPAAKVLFSTTNYHVFRSGLSARRVKMRAVGIGAKTKWYFWPNAAVREFVGLLSSHRVKQAVILGSMILFYVILTIVVYR